MKLPSDFEVEIQSAIQNGNDKIQRDVLLWSLPGWDSMKFVSFILAQEVKYDCKFSASEVAKVRTYGDLLDLMEQKICGS